MNADININDLTYQINGAIFEVSRTLGGGFLEKVYENALMIELRERGLKAESQVPIKVYYKKEAVGEYFADILVQDKVIIELKAVENLRRQVSAGEPAGLTSGKQIRDFLDVREAGRMIAEEALGSRQGPINICSGVPITVKELAERIADEYGRGDLLRFGARPDNLVDSPRVVGVRES